MYALLSEKNVTIFDEKEAVQKITYEDFYNKYQNSCKIIIDRINVDFSLANLKNCNFIDAYQSIQTQREILKPFEDVFLIRNNKYNILKKDCFFIQKSSINDSRLLDVVNTNGGAMFVEHAIAEFCKCVVEITQNTCWLYIAKHASSGIKIVVGIGSGIILSRILFESKQDISKILADTIRYLNRFGIKEKITIISIIGDIAIDGHKIIFLNFQEIASKINLKKQENIELMLMDFVRINKNIRLVFAADRFLKTFIKNNVKKIYLVLLCGIAMSLGIFMKIDDEISTQKNLIYEIEKTSQILAENKSKTFHAKIDRKSFAYIKSVVDLLKESKDPALVIKKISAILRKNQIIAEAILLEKCATIKIKCRLNKKKMADLQKLSNDQMQIQIIKTDNIANEYEEIDVSDDKNFGVEICIKVK